MTGSPISAATVSGPSASISASRSAAHFLAKASIRSRPAWFWMWMPRPVAMIRGSPSAPLE
jgi:hypothetical protein